jgi:KDO2-lipid IV(A) lauroyltransferase
LSHTSLAQPSYWPSWLLVGLIYVLGLLPLRVLWALGVPLGLLAYYVAGYRRRIALRNIALCFPELSSARVARLARRHFALLGQALLSAGVGWWASPRRLRRLVRFRGAEHLRAPMREGRNLIILAPHFLGLELAGIVTALTIHPGITMYQKIRNPVFDAQVRRARMRFGTSVVERHANLRRLISAVRGGTPFFYLPDQDPGPRRGIFVPFFGVPTATLPTLGRFAGMTDALVVPCFPRLLPRGKGLEVVFEPPLASFPSGDPQADTLAMNRVIERGVRLSPEQYFWVHRRFKTRPPREPSLYR